MRILIDECLPIQIRNFFTDDEAVTVMHMGWRSSPDAELLVNGEREGFDVFLTADAGIMHNHDLGGWHLAVVVVTTNRRKLLEQMADAVRVAVDEAKPGTFQVVPIR